MDSNLYKPIKDLGQNFLLDKHIAQNMIENLDVRSGDTIVEIGAGLGAVTKELVNKCIDESIKLYAVEVDQRFLPKLENMFLDNFNVHIIPADILEWLPTFKPTGRFKIIGSLPYYITSPIIHKILDNEERAHTVVILIQKEVAKRIAAKAPDSTYLSVVTQTFYDVFYLETVDKSLFDPVPQVDGGIIKLIKKPAGAQEGINIKRYQGFLHKGFSNPRKMLNKVFTQQELSLTGIDGSQRPQDIGAEKWLEAFLKLTPQ